MANNKQPVELLLLKGNKHLTKDEIEKRRDEEIKANTDNIIAPSYLNKKQKDRFDYLADELKQAKIISNLDVESLARYIVLEEQYNAVVKKISKLDVLNDDYDKLLLKQTKVFSMLDKLNNQLCLNIISRCKVSIPKSKEKPKNKFEKYNKKTDGGTNEQCN